MSIDKVLEALRKGRQKSFKLIEQKRRTNMSKGELGPAIEQLKTVISENGMELSGIRLPAEYKNRMRHLFRQEAVSQFAGVDIYWMGKEPEIATCLPDNEREVRLKDMLYSEAEALRARHAAGEPIEYCSISNKWFEVVSEDLYPNRIYRIPPETEFRIKDEVWAVFPEAMSAEVRNYGPGGECVYLYASAGKVLAHIPPCNVISRPKDWLVCTQHRPANL